MIRYTCELCTSVAFDFTYTADEDLVKRIAESSMFAGDPRKNVEFVRAINELTNHAKVHHANVPNARIEFLPYPRLVGPKKGIDIDALERSIERDINAPEDVRVVSDRVALELIEEIRRLRGVIEACRELNPWIVMRAEGKGE